jgi:hypothetical protein
LKLLYEAAESETERRDVALRGIDEGVIQTFGPVHVSTIDTIFGTHLASELPTRKEIQRKGIVDFVPSTASQKDGASVAKGWFMAVEYDHDGSIANYYVTNVRK